MEIIRNTGQSVQEKISDACKSFLFRTTNANCEK